MQEGYCPHCVDITGHRHAFKEIQLLCFDLSSQHYKSEPCLTYWAEKRIACTPLQYHFAPQFVAIYSQRPLLQEFCLTSYAASSCRWLRFTPALFDAPVGLLGLHFQIRQPCHCGLQLLQVVHCLLQVELLIRQ